MGVLEHINRNLYRDPNRAYIGGVCAGIAEYLNIDVLLVRLTAIVLFILTCGLIAALYLVLWVVLPVEPTETTFINVEPVEATSEYYDRIINTKTQKHREKATAETDQKSPSTQAPRRTSPEPLKSLSPALIIFALLCAFVTVTILMLVSAAPETYFYQYLPLYLIAFSSLLVTLPNSKRTFSARVASLVLCLEACVVLLPFTTGIFNSDSFSLMSGTTFLMWFVSLVFLVAAMIFDNTATYILAITMLLVATMMGFYDFGFLEPAVFLSGVDPEATASFMG